MAETASSVLSQTPLHARHVALGGKMVPFAGYDMPVQYPRGILGEHVWTREHAGLFDVSHMGQAYLAGPNHESTARAIEALVPSDVLNLAPGRLRYTVLTDENGGIIDDLMITRSFAPEDDGVLMLVVNASRKEEDYAHIAAHLPGEVRLVRRDDRALLALQGPEAEKVLARHCPEAGTLGFMGATVASFGGVSVHLSRSGYTGEDGFEISIPADKAGAIWDALLAHGEVEPIGLGARDSLRLEAGLPLYGHDIDLTTSPVEAGLSWIIQKRRRAEGGFPGMERILAELRVGPSRKRVGIRPDGRAPAREGTGIVDADGRPIGTVTSGGFAPSIGGPIAMGYVAAGTAEPGTAVQLVVRGEPRPAGIVAMPFVPHRYKR